MFLALWYSLRGYVKIKVTGFSAGRFMNMATYRGIYLWDIIHEGVSVTMKAEGGSLDVLQNCAEKTGCSMEVLYQGGLPRFCRKFRRKQVWSAGLLCFAAGLYLLSSFIWTIEVEGNERLQQEDVLSACRKMGLRPGVWKRNVDTGAIANELLMQFSDIAWVSVRIDGTDAAIRLTETIPQAEKVDRVTPCDIVASADGIILQVIAERGTPLVQAGDVVRKGDVLISSELVIGLEGEEQRTEYTAAEGTVIARIWQRVTEEVPLQYEEKIYSGVEKENYSILFSEKELDIIRPDGAGMWEKEICGEWPLKLGDFQTSFFLRKEIWKPYELTEKTRTPEEAKALLGERIKQKTQKLLTPEGKTEQTEINFEEYADSIRAEAEIILSDRIDEKRLIGE